MPRKPNYRFERHERDRAKTQKKAARIEAKAARREVSERKKNLDVDDRDAENLDRSEPG